MKKTLFESRLDNAIDAGSIGIGETVEIRNRMGKYVASGEVIATTPLGLSLREGGFYDRDLYLFSVLEPDSIEIVANQLLSSPDERVARRLLVLGEEVPMFESEKMDDNNYIDSNDVKKDDNRELKKDYEKNKGKEPLANPESSVDVNSLPVDIKKSIISIVQMNEEQLNGVLSEIGDATIKALKRMNIKELEIYGVVGRIQDSVEKVLTSSGK